MRGSSVVLAVLLSAVPLWADGPRVVEASTRVTVENDASVVGLEITAGETAGAKLVLEWVDPKGKVSRTAMRDLHLTGGRNQVRVALPLANATAWDRLHYRLSGDFAAQEGWLALTEIAEHVFSGALTAPVSPVAGEEFPIGFFATNPGSGKPVAGVLVTADIMTHGGTQSTMTMKGRTDASGFVLLKGRPPREAVELAPATIQIEARRADFFLAMSRPVTLWPAREGPGALSLVSDKPIYQPGQTVHVRALAFDSARHAVAAGEVTFEVKAPDDTLLYHKTVQTSRFGVSSADWTIPSNLRLGDYSATVQLANQTAETSVKVSRYELPQFSVTVKPDRAYYLSKQAANIEIRVDYLFGKPVAGAGIRVVREEDRVWNYTEQKWDVEEHESYTGLTDASGKFTVKLTPGEFAGEQWERYRDFDFAAYVTDTSTGRTEQKRFALRVTDQAIHLYWTTAGEVGYVSATYADGTAAECDVAVSVDKEKPLLRVRTNRYGVARVIAPPDHGMELALTAADGHGATGEHREVPRQPERSTLTIHSDRTLYRPGEPIVVEIHSAVPDQAVMLETYADYHLVAARAVTLRGNDARVTLPFLPAYQREVSVLASTGSAESAVRAERDVLYPSAAGVKLDVRLSKAVYAPGKDAAADIRVTDLAGKPVESALGVVITDKAVDLRASSLGTEPMPGMTPMFRPCSFWDACFMVSDGFGMGQTEVGGISLRDLYNLDVSRPVSQDLDLVAELLLARTGGYAPGYYPNYGYTQGMNFQTLVDREFAPLASALGFKNSWGYESFPRNEEDLTRQATAKGVDWHALRDPWGMPYRVRFRLQGGRFLLEFLSSGPDKRFDSADDFVANVYSRDYFAGLQTKIAQALKSVEDVPDERAFDAALRQAGITSDQFRDPLGRPYRVKVQTYGGQRAVTVLPATAAGEPADYPLANFQFEYFRGTRRRIQQAVYTAEQFPKTEGEFRAVLSGAGIDLGSLRDAWGNAYSVTTRQDAIYGHHVEPPASGSGPRTVTPVTVQRLTIALRSSGPDGKPGTGDEFDVASFSHALSEEGANDRGPVKREAGRAAATGAVAGVINDLSGASLPRAEILLKGTDTGIEDRGTSDNSGSYYIGGLFPGTYELTVQSPGFIRFRMVDVVVIGGQVTNVDAVLGVASVTETVEVQASSQSVAGPSGAKSTPRLREYFPETLLWEPLLETGRDGRARLRFKLADNLTTWKMSVIGSTADGRMETAETEFKTFQPFFVDLETPPTLTQGDRVTLPAVVRNYLGQPQTVEASLAAQAWIEAPGPAAQKLTIAPGEAATATFPIRASISVREGPARLTATSRATGDAIERVVAVHPDGQERAATASDVFHTKTSLTIAVAKEIVAGSLTGELRIYPNLFAHVVASIGAVLQRPWGCAEQTISSTYPSVYAVRLLTSLGVDNGTTREARQNVELGYQRLLRFHRDGAFEYFSGHGTDLALTAYALEFLNDAAGVVEVDDQVRQSIANWLVHQQRADGSWQWAWAGHDLYEQHRTAVLTATVARALAAGPGGKAGGVAADSLKRAFVYLSKTADDEPYLLASYALAAFDTGDNARGRELLARLRSLAREEGPASFWGLRFCTPYYGWGRAGSLEVSGLVLRALARAPEYRALATRALQFLLRYQDRYGIWYSSQATRQALGALVAFAEAFPQEGEARDSMEVVVNGKAAGKVAMPPAREAGGMIPVDVSRFLAPGENRVELRGASDRVVSAQLVASYYVPWTRQGMEPVVLEESRLELGVAFDRQELRLGESVTCNVKAQRVGAQGYGMMMAEIGLPPGAEVDRESIKSEYYEVLPDRVVFYLWPTARGTALSFRFRPRLAIEAKNASSRVYDYYNPEPRTEIAPVMFVVH